MKKIRIGFLPRIIAAILLGMVCGLFFPAWGVRLFNTFNGIFSQLLGFFVPLIILGFVAPSIAELEDRAGKMLLITVALAYLSTVCSGTLSFLTSSTVLPHLIGAGSRIDVDSATAAFDPFFTMSIPPMLDVIGAIVLAFALGLAVASMKGATYLRGVIFEFRTVIEKVISKLIVPLLPIYIFGIFLNMSATGNVMAVMSVFVKVIVLVVIMHICWLLILFCVGGAVSRRNPFKLIRTMIPSYLTALGTQSSVATIPVNLKQVKELGVSEEVGGFVVPLCATIHLSGSILQITAFAVALMIMQGLPFSFGMFLGFVCLLGVVMVAAPGVPGGAIMAALGVLGSVLGFSAADQALMISLYVAVDSFGTATNVTGDGVIALIVDRIKKITDK